ncbi:MAG: hypothetical protein R3C68_02560 [Myxococcota bacterium]
MNAETPPGAKDAQSPQENYGEMTTAWFPDAGSQVAEYEAGRAAESANV